MHTLPADIPRRDWLPSTPLHRPVKFKAAGVALPLSVRRHATGPEGRLVIIVIITNITIIITYAVGVHNNTLYCSWLAFVFRLSSYAHRQFDESKTYRANGTEHTRAASCPRVLTGYRCFRWSFKKYF